MFQNRRRTLAVAILFVGFSLPVARTAVAQIEGEAIPGRPFGIGRIEVPLTVEDVPLLETRAQLVTEQNGRIFYPTFSQGGRRPVLRLLNRVIGNEVVRPATSLEIQFLFTGGEPLHLTVHTARKQVAFIVPEEEDARKFNREMRDWWRDYNKAARKQADEGDYPATVNTYLTSMLASRLGFQAPLIERLRDNDENELQRTVDLLLGAEDLRTQIMRDTMLRGNAEAATADLPLPENALWTPRPIPVAPDDVDIEPMAMHVPEECFYVRFGTFDNFIWLTGLLKDISSDAGEAINLRGHESAGMGGLEKKLALKQTKIGELFGGTTVVDVAMIGRDIYIADGPAVGMLFQSRNELFERDTRSKRQAALEAEKENGATLETLKIAGHDVTFLSTPDNRLRSFYAIDGNFHLVTTSRAMVERFYEAGAGRGTLGKSDEFRHARTLMPTDREDTVFVYFSSAFFRGLMGPQYQIELARRIRSMTDMQLLKLAKPAAKNEGLPSETVNDLIAAGLLPPGFGIRPDGSRLVVQDGQLVDSLRGPKGSFVPVPDVKIAGVTATERNRYAAQAAYYQQNWKQMDPLMVAVKRFSLGDNTERLVVDGNLSLLGEEKYGWLLSILGPPTKEQISHAPGDIITVQASVKGGLLFPSIPPHYLFARIQDTAAPQTDLRPAGLFKTIEILRTTPGYLGAWPKPGFLDLLPFGLAGEPDFFGYSRLPFRLWRWQGDGFSVLSFDRAMLERVTPFLQPEPAEDPAQLRLHVGDLSQSKLKDWVSWLNYQRALQTTQGNLRMMHTLSQQLGIPRADARAVAEDLLGVKLVCTLGGQYKTAQTDDGLVYWETTKWQEDRPTDYEAPLLTWFRGLDASLTRDVDRLMLHAQIDMQRAASGGNGGGFKLPSFNLFGKPNEDEKKPEEEKRPEEPEPGPRRF